MSTLSDAFLIRYNSGGIRQSTQFLGILNGTSDASSIAIASDDSIYIGGTTTLAFTGNTASGGTVDYFIAKYSNA